MHTQFFQRLDRVSNPYQHQQPRRWRAALWAALLLTAVPARAVLFYGTGAVAYNVLPGSPPGGAVADSGWQYHGLWDNATGIAISPYYFITAKHLGGSVGQTFTYGGTPYTTVASFDEPDHDLRIWQVSAPLPSYAPLYQGIASEAGQPLVVHGRGTQRGAEVNVLANPVGDQLRGWLWGFPEFTLRWGENDVTSIVIDPVWGDLLYATFDRPAYEGGKVNEATLSAWDSGGGVFVQEGGVWKLAGINLGVDGPFRETAAGPDFLAAVFDAGGLYWDIPPTPGFDLIANGATDISTGFYATRIASHLDWINGVVPEPRWNGLLGGIAVGLLGVVGWWRQCAARRK